MGSKVIGFRLPEDMVNDLEKTCKERGITVAEFLRSLIDETLYPSASLQRAEDDEVTREVIEVITNTQQNLADDVKELRRLVDEIGTSIAGYELNDILSTKTIESLQEINIIKNTLNTLEHRVETLSISSRTSRDISIKLNEYKSATDRKMANLQKEISNLRSQIGILAQCPIDIEQLKSDVFQLQTNLALIQRDTKRKPTDEIRTVSLTDGKEHKFRVYSSPSGLERPEVAYTDLILGKRYIDLKEPLD